jgi:8-oxo-dGTP pyrophosphatase MutT (NUDIX family)
MFQVVWIVLRQNDRLLLTQRALNDQCGGTWVLPGGKIDKVDITPVHAAYRELKEKINLEGKRFRLLCSTYVVGYNIRIFICDKWCGELKPVRKDIIGVGWFTPTEMYSLKDGIAPFLKDSLTYVSYLIQHYDHHPNEWDEQWVKCDDGE